MGKKIRRAQSTIVGSTFVILIIISTYGLYLSYTNSQRTYDQLQKDMRDKDFERQNERLEYYYDGEEDSEEVELYVQNTGSQSAHIIYINDLGPNHGDNIIINSTDFYLSPGNNINLIDFLNKTGITIRTHANIQLISARGKVYQTLYEPIKKRPISRIVMNDFLEALTHTFGDFIILYTTWGQADFNVGNVYSKSSWSNNWHLDSNKDLIFRINVTYYGEIEPVIINQSTELMFYQTHSQSGQNAYVIANIGKYNNEQLVGYGPDNPLEIWWGENVTLYFGTPHKGNDPGGVFFPSPGEGKRDIYTGVIVIYDSIRKYSQSYPLIGIEIS